MFSRLVDKKIIKNNFLKAIRTGMFYKFAQNLKNRTK